LFSRVLGLLVPVLSLSGSEFYASVSAASGDGSRANPWSIGQLFGNPQPAAITAAVKSEAVTVWVRGGACKAGTWSPRIIGNATYRVILRAFPGERVCLDRAGANDSTQALVLSASHYADYIGLEVTDSDLVRAWGTTGSTPPNGKAGIVNWQGSVSVRIIYGYLHDAAGDGVGWWRGSSGELYGNLIVNNGWNAPDRWHGHCIYTQNSLAEATKVIKGNILSAIGDGHQTIQVYTQGGEISNYEFTNNIAYRNRWLVGGYQPAKNITLTGNHIRSTAQFGYSNKLNEALALDGNKFTGSVSVSWWNAVTAANNVFRSGKVPFAKDGNGNLALTFDRNRWQITGGTAQIASANSTNYTFATWQAAGRDLNGVREEPPNIQEVSYIRVDDFEARRCHIVVYNWPDLATGDVDLSQCGFVSGELYQIQDVQAMAEAPLHTGTYTGAPISVNLAYAGVTEPTGVLTCPTCRPYTFAKTAKTWRAYLVRRHQTVVLLTFTARNPFPSATQLRLNLGPTATLLDFPSQTVACAYNAICTVLVDCHWIGPMYYEWIYKDTAGNAVARSAVMPIRAVLTS